MYESALEFHKQVLNSVRVKDINDDGYMTAVVDGTEIPVTIGGKRLVLPTKEILKKSPWADCIGYNPFSERLTRGESPILKFTKDAISLRVNELFGKLLTSLVLVASDPALQKRMGPKVAELLKACPEASDKTLTKAKKLADIVHRQPQHNFISMYLKHGGENGASRTCVVSFPIHEQLADEESIEIAGNKLLTSAKDKDKARLRGLIEYILGELGSYTHGSDSQEAPYYHSLLTSYGRLAVRMNGLLTKYKKVIEEADEFKIDVEWIESLENFEAYRGQIPSLEGNEGVVLADNEDKEKSAGNRAFSREQSVDEGSETRRKDRDDRERDRDDRSSRERDRERERNRGDDDPMESFRRQFESDQDDRSTSWGRGKERDSWGRSDRDDRDRDRGGRSRRRDRDRGRRGGGRRGW